MSSNAERKSNMSDDLVLSHDVGYAGSLDKFDSANYPKAKSAFGYYGAKQKVAPRILQLLPPHHCWVELFCGSASITLAKQAAPIEIINDIDGEIVNVFKQLRNRPEELIKAIELTPYARDEFFQARANGATADDLERARMFLVEAMMSLNGVLAGSKGGFSYSNSYTRSGREARVNRWANFPERLIRVAERLRDVRIENMDAVTLLKKFVNRPATLVYLDPPYLIDRTSGYTHDVREKDFHIELLTVCNKAKCMVLVSGYDNPIYNELLDPSLKWRKVVIGTYTTAACGTKFDRNEVVWINESASKALDRNRIPIRLSKKERLARKLNPTRGI